MLQVKLGVCADLAQPIVDTASRLYLSTTETDKEERLIAITAAIRVLDAAMSTEATRRKILSNPEFNRDVLVMAAKLLKRATPLTPGPIPQALEEASDWPTIPRATVNLGGTKRAGPQLEDDSQKRARTEAA